MYELYTLRARKIMQLANQEAQRFNHEYIGTEHLLLALVKEGNGIAARVLKHLGVDLRRLRLEVEKLVQSGPEMITMGKLPQTPFAKKALAFALEESVRMEHNFVGSEHLLLGLLNIDEGIVVQIFKGLNVEVEKVREDILDLLGKCDLSNRAPAVFEKKKINSPNSPFVPKQVKDLTHDLNYLKESSLDTYDVCDNTMDQISIGLRRHCANNLFLIGTPEQVNVYVETAIRSGIQLSFRDFAKSKYVCDAEVYEQQVTEMLSSLFRSLAIAIVFHNFQMLFQSTIEKRESLGSKLGPWLEFPNLHVIAYGNQKQKEQIVDMHPHIGRHFSVVELPPLSKTQMEQIIAREVKVLERFHLCTFSTSAITLAIDHFFVEDPQPVESRIIVGALDQAATKMQLEFREENVEAKGMDRAIRAWTEQFATSAIAGKIERVNIESKFVNDTFAARQKIKPFPVVGAEQVREFLKG